LIGSRVSKATGTKWWLSKKWSYLVIFLVAANSDAAPAAAFVACRYDGATVSIMVASHTRLRPPRHGINVSPSGFFPSVRESPGGSLMLGIPAFVRPRLTMSFIFECLAIRPGLRPHDRPCELFAVTTATQRHISSFPGGDPPQLGSSRHPFATHMMRLEVQTASHQREVLMVCILT